MRVGSIHGDKSQTDRDNVLNDFRLGRANILVATDVAARGLDVDGIKYVINFDFPQSSEDYIHRIGRTGRKHSTGTSYAFFTRKNARCAKALIDVLREARQNVNPDLEFMANNADAILSKDKMMNRAKMQGGGAGGNRRGGGGGNRGGPGGGQRFNNNNNGSFGNANNNNGMGARGGAGRSRGNFNNRN